MSNFLEMGYASQEAMDLDLAMKKARGFINHYEISELNQPLENSTDEDIVSLKSAVYTIQINKHLLFSEEKNKIDELLGQTVELLDKLRNQ